MVARTAVSEFTGKTINHRYLANQDALGKGPANRVRIGRRICYPVDSLIAWLEDRAEVVE